MKEKKTESITIKITKTMKNELEQIQLEEKREFSDLIRYMLQNEIEQYKKWGKKKSEYTG